VAGVRTGEVLRERNVGVAIIDQNGAATGVVSVERSSPVIVDSLSAQLVRTILAEASGANPVPIRAMEDC
jgi:hypothetical protein